MDRAYARMSLAADRVDAFREDIRGIMRGKDVPTDVLILQLRDRPLHPSRTEVPFRRHDPSPAGPFEYPDLFALYLPRASRRAWELWHHTTSSLP